MEPSSETFWKMLKRSWGSAPGFEKKLFFCAVLTLVGVVLNWFSRTPDFPGLVVPATTIRGAATWLGKITALSTVLYLLWKIPLIFFAKNLLFQISEKRLRFILWGGMFFPVVLWIIGQGFDFSKIGSGVWWSLAGSGLFWWFLPAKV